MTDFTLTEDEDEQARQASLPDDGRPSLANYTFGKILGTGSFATCWSATHRRTGQAVAIKVIEVNAGQAQQQMSEIETMVKVGRHPNVLEILDASLQGNRIYLVSPLCRQSLAERISQHTQGLLYTQQQLLDWMTQVAQALHLLHRSQIVHCDIKPENLLLDGRDRLLVADLGQARPLQDPRPRMGSYFYMPPEQAAGHSPQIGWDAYAWGACFYCALTGYPPRSRSFSIPIQATHGERLAVYRDQLPRAPLLTPPHASQALWAILRWTLELDPSRRCADMGQLLARLRSLPTAGAQPQQKWQLAGLTVAIGLGMGLLVMADAILLQELLYWLALSLGVLARVVLVSALAGALTGALGAALTQRKR